MDALLFVMLTANDWQDSCNCSSASSYCGSNDSEQGYPDLLPLGHPFTNPLRFDIASNVTDKFPEDWILPHTEEHIRVIPLSIWWGPDRVYSPPPKPKKEGVLTGRWNYRSYRNDVGIQNPANKVEEQAEAWKHVVFGEGILTLQHNPKRNTVDGAFDFRPKYKLNVKGTVDADQTTINMEAVGIPDTPTKDWDYKYIGYVAPVFSEGLPQTEPLTVLGTVMRAREHDTAPAFYCASFQMVKM